MWDDKHTFSASLITFSFITHVFLLKFCHQLFTLHTPPEYFIKMHKMSWLHVRSRAKGLFTERLSYQAAAKTGLRRRAWLLKYATYFSHTFQRDLQDEVKFAQVCPDRSKEKQPWRCSCFKPNRRGQSYIYLVHTWHDQEGTVPGTNWPQFQAW